ncbi:MAG TPA: glutamate racemase [Dysgonamonadaceae bacterium]|nr:glutamate racemase [Dysgonamonadaceae bacterium]
MTNNSSLKAGPIGVFDSGYGGLTVLSEIKKLMPEYDYLYLGDNARAPYGNRSYELIYEFTLQAVKWLFSQGCQLVIIACNSASAKALRSIQQKDLPQIDSIKRVLGVIRPTAETVLDLTKTKHIAVLGTEATISSKTYEREIEEFCPTIKISTEACPMWVPLVENKEYDKEGADYFVKQHIDRVLEKDKDIDAIILGCTHYPLLIKKIEQYTPKSVKLISQGEYVAKSLREYLNRHQTLDSLCSKGETRVYCTTDSTERFESLASFFLNEEITANKVSLNIEE